jgi:iron complex transport system permease protein
MVKRPKALQVAVLLGLALIAVACLSAALGPVHLTREIFWQLRFPRVVLGFLVGMALASAGVIFQGLLRNPLADPFILGTSSGASLGVLAASMLHLHSAFWLYGLALLGAQSAIFVVHRIARTHGKTPVQTLILSGVLVSTFLNSLVFLGVSLFYKEAMSTLFFLLGSLTETDPVLLRLSGILIIGSIGFAWILSRSLNVLSQGDETAFHLGIDPERTRVLLFFVASTMVSASVAVSGMIGFVGLMVPHMMRLIVGPDHRLLLPASAIGGGILLMGMDTAARTVAAPIEIPVGILTALGGTPFLIYLLRQKKGEFF